MDGWVVGSGGDELLSFFPELILLLSHTFFYLFSRPPPLPKFGRENVIIGRKNWVRAPFVSHILHRGRGKKLSILPLMYSNPLRDPITFRLCRRRKRELAMSWKKGRQ